MSEEQRDKAFAGVQPVLDGLIGRTIVSAKPYWGGGGWGEHLSFELTLDDGRTVSFSGWGHDAWGADIDVAGGCVDTTT